MIKWLVNLQTGFERNVFRRVLRVMVAIFCVGVVFLSLSLLLLIIDWFALNVHLPWRIPFHVALFLFGFSLISWAFPLYIVDVPIAEVYVLWGLRNNRVRGFRGSGIQFLWPWFVLEPFCKLDAQPIQIKLENIHSNTASHQAALVTFNMTAHVVWVLDPRRAAKDSYPDLVRYSREELATQFVGAVQKAIRNKVGHMTPREVIAPDGYEELCNLVEETIREYGTCGVIVSDNDTWIDLPLPKYVQDAYQELWASLPNAAAQVQPVTQLMKLAEESGADPYVLAYINGVMRGNSYFRINQPAPPQAVAPGAQPEPTVALPAGDMQEPQPPQPPAERPKQLVIEGEWYPVNPDYRGRDG